MLWLCLGMDSKQGGLSKTRHKPEGVGCLMSQRSVLGDRDRPKQLNTIGWKLRVLEPVE